MSEKNRDARGRWRHVTVAFRISAEENEELNTRVRLSGLTKQDYITRRLLEKEITVVANPRVYKALRDEMTNIASELRRIAPDGAVEEKLCDVIALVAQTVQGME